MVLISVVMPVYNKELFLSKSIQSVLTQNFSDFELILIDDGSIDNSAEICRKYLKLDTRIKYYYQRNKGVSAARNKGIALAKGVYISFLDADDYWEDSFLKKMITGISNKNVCYCGRFNLINDKKIKKDMEYYAEDVFKLYLQDTLTPHTNSWLIKKSYLQENSILFNEDLNWGEDKLFFSKVLLHDQSVQYVSEALTVYTIGVPNSLSEKSILDTIEKDKIWIALLKKHISKYENDELRRKEFISIIDGYLMPGLILTALMKSFYVLDLNYLNRIYKKNKEVLCKVNNSNGQYSIKLKLKLFLFRIKLNILLAKSRIRRE